MPDFGRPATMPALSRDEYDRRLDVTLAKMRDARLDFLAVYADREHFANLAWLTGFDPRFEEALLLISAAGDTLLMVGNECMGYLPEHRPKLRVQLFQEFSLLGQPRSGSPALRDIFSGFGIGAGKRVGCAGWKYFEDKQIAGGERAIEIPSYLVDALRELTGGIDRIVNATAIFMGLDGLRQTISVTEIAQFEFAATRASDSIWNLLRVLRDGSTERQLALSLFDHGVPHSCHAMVSTGAKAKRGLSSPGDAKVKLGDPFTTALGVWGSLVCRAGFVARGPEDVPAVDRDRYAALASNYFEVFAAWYESLRVGVTAGEVFAAADAKRDGSLWDFALNPGHTIHLDEWVNSPFARGSRFTLHSGMAIQMDIIPVPKGFKGHACVNAEDGIVLADENLRKELASQFPDCWKRIQARQAFMRGVLGIQVDDAVLPLCNVPGAYPPYLLSGNAVLVKG